MYYNADLQGTSEYLGDTRRSPIDTRKTAPTYCRGNPCGYPFLWNFPFFLCALCVSSQNLCVKKIIPLHKNSGRVL